jgi:hypothetical protein
LREEKQPVVGGRSQLGRGGAWVLAAVALAAVALFFLATNRETQRPPEAPPGSFAFAVLGDAPYYPWEEIQFRRVLGQLDAAKLEWVLHVGDIFWHPCSDAMYEKHLAYFQRLRHPLIYTPGDNEWCDCHEPGSGSFAPLGRLARIREIFFADPTSSLGGSRLPLVSQASEGSYSEFKENARWEHAGIVFATAHLPGSRNGGEAFPGRTEADDTASRRRVEAAAAWLREAFSTARARRARAVFVAFHTDLHLDLEVEHPERQALEPFVAALEEESERFDGSVVFAHGDDHQYTVDRPLVRHTTGRRLANVTRLEVPGSPDVGWVRVVVAPQGRDPFTFEEHVIPRWQYW